MAYAVALADALAGSVALTDAVAGPAGGPLTMLFPQGLGGASLALADALAATVSLTDALAGTAGLADTIYGSVTVSDSL